MQKATFDDASIAKLDDPFTTKLNDASVQDPENGESDAGVGETKDGETKDGETKNGEKKKPKKPNRRAGLGKKRGTGFEGKSDRRWVFAP